MSRLIAMAIPVLKGKENEWKKFSEEMNGRWHKDFMESRKRMNVHERVFLQETPMGQLVIVTLEGENPEKAFSEFAKGNDDFTRWFVKSVKELHGFDLNNPPQGGMPEHVIDSRMQIVNEKAK